MATEPVKLPEWASANPTDGVSGQAAIIEPSEAKKDSGFLRLERSPRQDHNWLFNLIFQWFEWLKQQENLNTPHRTGDGSDHSDVALNTTHSGSDGSDHSDVGLNTTHRGVVSGNPHNVGATEISDFDSEVDSNASVTANTNHRNDDGSDHADVATNTSHSGGDGSDHADVAANTSAAALNTTHRTSDGKNHSDVVLNNTHRGLTTGNPHNVVAADLTLPVTLVTQLTGQSFLWPSNIDDNSSVYSSDLAVAAAKVGDIVLVTPTDRVVATDQTNRISFEGIVASAGNIKVNAVNHHSTSVSDNSIEALSFNVTIISFT